MKEPLEVSAKNVEEAVESALNTLGLDRSQVEIEVYAWRLGMFMYDQELSWAMAMSDDLFPAPTAEEVDAEDTGP